MKNKAVSLLFCSLLTVLFCLILSNVQVNAKTISGIHTSPANSDVYINSGSTWNQTMSSAGQDAQPSSAFNNYQYVTQFCATQGSWQAGFSIYSIDPSTFTGGYITINGAEYYCKYPCGFVNYYKDGVEIPNGYTAVSGSYPRSILYPNYNFGSGNVLWSAYFQPSQGENIVFCYFSDMDGNNVHFPDPLASASYGYASRYYNGNYADGTPDFCYYIDSNGCRGYSVGTVSVPIFCDLNDAIYYMENGVILDNDHVLAGADTAVVTPTPTPTATPIPHITGSVSINGEVIIGNWPTASPTPEPTPTPTPVPYGDIFDNNVSDGGAISITGIDSSGLKEKVKNSIEISDGFMPLHYPLEEIPGYTNGDSSNVFNNYPKAAMNYLTTAQTNEDSSFVGFLINSVGIFSNSTSSSSGFSVNVSSPLFWFLSAIVLMIFVTVLKKIL